MTIYGNETNLEDFEKISMRYCIFSMYISLCGLQIYDKYKINKYKRVKNFERINRNL